MLSLLSKRVFALVLCGALFFSFGCSKLKPHSHTSFGTEEDAVGAAENPSDPIFPHSDGWESPSVHGVWIVEQGSYDVCLNCHSIGSSAGEVSPSTSTSGTGIPTCNSCHPLYPHGDNWGSGENHGAEVLENGTGNCATQCHGTDLQGGLSGVSCNSCHPDYPHPSEGIWLPFGGGHGERIQVAYDGSTSACQLCHGSDLQTVKEEENCFTCHPSYPHSLMGAADWNEYEGHGTYGMTNSIEGCKLCHGDDYQGGSRNNPSCYTCHPSFPHAEGWAEPSTGHGVYVGTTLSNDTVPCQLCHGADLKGGHSGVSCEACHAGGGGCTGCHASSQDNGDGKPAGGRRAVVGEFPSGTNAHHGATLEGTDCLVCHSQDTHKDGNVDLIDADDSSLYTFEMPADLSTDPDLSDFCSSCHDADGAARLPDPFDPFGTGSVPPDVATQFQGTLQWNEWYGDFCFGSEGTLRPVNSHHDISDADQAFSGAKIECLDCHSGHTAAASQPLVDPFNKSQAWTGNINNFCLRCHEGGTSPLVPDFPTDITEPSVALRGIDSCDYGSSPWHVDYTWTHEAHGPDSKRAWSGYSGAPDAVVDCVDCHDPHGSYTETNTEGNPYMIRDFVDGTSYVDDGTLAGGFNGPPWSTFGTAREVVVPVSGIDVGWGDAQGLCAVCHVDWVDAMWAHGFCTGCQTCHGHGQAWGAADTNDYNDATSCGHCGNGLIDGLEQCDDGGKCDDNNADCTTLDLSLCADPGTANCIPQEGDGCSNECTNE